LTTTFFGKTLEVIYNHQPMAETSKNQPKSVSVITLGCAKNTVDSEVILGLLAKNGYAISFDPYQADIIIINTCGFIEDAKKESIDVILDAVVLKKLNPRIKVFVTGCLSQRYYESLKKEIPEVDGFLGVENFNKIAEFISEEKKDSPIWKPGKSGSFLYDHATPRIMSTPPYMAYSKIAEGCSHTCSFCAIPMIRGAFKSREPESIIEEARVHALKGVRELILISQDTSYWGRDLEKKYHLSKLLEKLNEIEGLEWIRLLYLHPDEIDDKLLKAMAKLEHVVHYVDIPFQHVNKRILKLMGRGYKADFRSLIRKIRDIFSNDVAIRSTFLVGFPGETDEEFEEILDFLEDAKLDRVTAFPYSDEDSTEAYKMPDKLYPEIARQRYEILMECQSNISFAINESFIGKTMKVLVERESKENGRRAMVGRSYRDAPEVDGVVFFHGDAKVGEFVNVKITDARDYDLVGEML